jgi:hypothetical protein
MTHDQLFNLAVFLDEPLTSEEKAKVVKDLGTMLTVTGPSVEYVLEPQPTAEKEPKSPGRSNSVESD